MFTPIKTSLLKPTHNKPPRVKGWLMAKPVKYSAAIIQDGEPELTSHLRAVAQVLAAAYPNDAHDWWNDTLYYGAVYKGFIFVRDIGSPVSRATLEEFEYLRDK